jgi:chromosome segregation ATPase
MQQLLRDTMEGNQEFRRAKDDQIHIAETMATASKNIASAEFELLKINESIKLAVSEKEKEVLQRKRYMEEYESLKTILGEIKSLNDVRINQETSIKMRESIDIQKGDYQTKKLEKSLEEIKKKLSRSEESEKVLRQEVEYLERELAKVTAKKDGANATLTKLITENDKQDTFLSSLKNEFRKMEDQF